MNQAIATTLVLLLLTTSAFARRKPKKSINIEHSIAIPHGATRDFTDKTSFRGFLIEGKKYVNKHSTIGASLKWNSFEGQAIDDEIIIDSQTIFGNSQRFTHAVPIMISTSYYHFDRRREPLTPYFSFAAGAIFQSQTTQIGGHSKMTSGWMIGASPEIGICYTLPDSIDLIANYQYLFGLGYSNIPHLSYSTLNIGIGVTF